MQANFATFSNAQERSRSVQLLFAVIKFPNISNLPQCHSKQVKLVCIARAIRWLIIYTVLPII